MKFLAADLGTGKFLGAHANNGGGGAREYGVRLKSFNIPGPRSYRVT